MRLTIRRFAILLFGCASVSLLAVCGPTGAELLGDAMVDAGVALRDSAADDAAAQEGCGMCTSGGALRVVTADTDATRLQGDTILIASASAPVQVLEGPFVLTDAETRLGWGVVLTVSETGACDDVTPGTRRVVAQIAAPAIGITDRDEWFIHGGRILIPAGSSLCAERLRDQDSLLFYAGFVPYE